MNRQRIAVFVGIVSLCVFYGEVIADTIVSGDLKIRDGGDMVFSDGSVQSKAQIKGETGLQGPPGPANTLSIGTVLTGDPGTAAAAAITGTAPNQTLNLVIPQGVPGPQGATGSGGSPQWRMTKETTVAMIPAIGASLARTQTSTVLLYYDTVGKNTGYFNTSQTYYPAPSVGMTNPNSSQSTGYYTNYDTHNNPLSGIQTSNGPTSQIEPMIQIYSYDTNGNTTQRVRTYYDSNNNITSVQTRNYDVNHKGATTSIISVNASGSSTQTTTYSYPSYDPNGYPSMATTATTRVDTSTNPPTTSDWPGYALFDYEQFIPASSSSLSPAPYIKAVIFGYPSLTSPIGWTGSVKVYDNEQQTPITNATVSLTVNGITTPLSYNSSRRQYAGSLAITPGAQVALNVTVGATTYSATGAQYTTFPTITAPQSGAIWSGANTNTITWTGGAPTAGAVYFVGLLASDGKLVYPVEGGGFANLPTTTTSYPIPVNSGFTPGSYHAFVGIGTPGIGNEASGSGISIPGAASGSALWIGAASSIPFTITQ